MVEGRPQKVLNVWLLSGSKLAEAPLEEGPLQDVGALKIFLKDLCGLPPFLQVLLYDQVLLDDSARLDALPGQDVQLAFVPISEPTQGQRAELYQGLYEASRAGFVDVSRLLLHARADARDGQAALAIHEASERGNVELLQLLGSCSGT